MVNCDLQIGDALEDAASDTLPCDLGEEALYEIEPGRRGRNKVHVEPGMALQPLHHIRMFMGRIIVCDQVKIKVLRRVIVDRAQKLDEFLVAVAIQTATDHPAVQQAQSRKQGRGAMTLVIVGPWYRPGPFSAATPAGFGRAPESGSSRPPTTRAPCPAGRNTGRRYRPVLPRSSDRSTA